MHRETRMVGQPLPDLGVLMRSVVVRNHMDVQVSWNILVDPCEKGKEFLVAMPRLTIS